MSWLRSTLWGVWEGVGTMIRWLGQGLAPPEANRPKVPFDPPEANPPEANPPAAAANTPPGGITMKDYLTHIYTYFQSPEGVELTNFPVDKELGETLLKPGGGEFPEISDLIAFLYNRGMYLLMTYNLINEKGVSKTRGFSLTNKWLTGAAPIGDLDIENNMRTSDDSGGEWAVDYSVPFRTYLKIHQLIRPRRFGGAYLKCKLNRDFPKDIAPDVKDYESLAAVLQINTPGNSIQPEIPCFIWSVSQYLTRFYPSTYPSFKNTIEKVAAASLQYHRDGFIKQTDVQAVATKLDICIVTRCKKHSIATHSSNCTCGVDTVGPVVKLGLVDNHYFVMIPLKCHSKDIGVSPNKLIRNTNTLMRLLPDSEWAESFDTKELLTKLNKPIKVGCEKFTEEMCKELEKFEGLDKDYRCLENEEEFGWITRSLVEERWLIMKDKQELLYETLYKFATEQNHSNRLEHLRKIHLPAYEIVLDIETCSVGEKSIVWPYSTSICYQSSNGYITECFFSNVHRTSLAMALDKITALNNIRIGHTLKYNGIDLKTCRTEDRNKFIETIAIVNPPTVWCHVLSFDFSPVLREERMIRVYEVLGSLGSLKSCKLEWCCLGKKLPIIFKNSFSLIPAPLAKFGSMFDLTQHKAPFPYDFFTESRCMEYTKSGWYGVYTSLEEFMESIPIKNRPALKSALEESLALKDGRVDIRRYVTYYNNLDVIVTMQGIMKFRNIYKDTFGCDISNKCTIGGCSIKLATDMACLDSTQDLKGEMSELVRSNIRGGYVFTRDNRPNFVVNGCILDTDEVLKGTLKQAIDIVLSTNRGEKQVFDLDVNSLYPYSQKELPSGNVRYVSLEEVNQYLECKWLLCTYEITKLNSDYDIQFLPITRDDRRIFPKTLLEGEVIYLMGFKHTRDIMHSMGMKLGEHYQITSAVLWEYTNYSLGYLTDKLYRMRQEAVKENNSGLSNVLKLNLNNTWGKCGEKTYNTETSIYNANNDVFTNHSVKDIPRILEYEISGDITSVTRYKKLRPTYKSKSHVAMAVTERAKEVMFNYFRAFVDAGLYVLAHDTDSVHCCGTPEQVSTGMRIYTDRHGVDPEKPDVNGNNPLGGMKSDFDGGSMFSGKVESQISRDHINVAPKLYCVVVEVTGKDKGDDESSMRYYGHVKAKGISKIALENFINSCEGKDRREKILVAYTTLAWNIYHKRMNESVEEVIFNMLAGGISIAYSAAGSVYRQKFERKM